MFKSIVKSKLFYLIALYYIILLIWWVKIYLSGSHEGAENSYFGLAYSFIALVGAINGLLVSRKWGGLRSVVGKAVTFMSLGLLLEGFGQLVWSYYNIFSNIEVPFPSIADVGYFLMIPIYTLGVIYIAKSAGANFALRKITGLQVFVALCVPLIMLGVTYNFLLKSVVLDTSTNIEIIRTFLNFYSPLGEAITISITMMAYFLCYNYLGGRMKGKILYVLCAMIFEFITGMTFLYQAAAGTYYNAGINDLMFTTSFTIMSIGLMLFKNFDE
jgi:hypothetical protein